MKLNNQKLRKVTVYDFWKGLSESGGAVKSQKRPQNWGFRGFDKILSIQVYFGYFNMKELMIFSLSVQTACLGKIKFLKTCEPIRIQDCLNYYIKQTRWFMKLNFLWYQ